MSRAGKKQNTKVLQTKRYQRRQWLSFLRMVRYGTNNFTRNAWLTIAATAVMTITLLIIFMTVASQNVLTKTATSIGEKVDISIYLKTETTKDQAEPVIDELKQLSNTKEVSFISADDARKSSALDNKTDGKVLDAITEATNKLPGTLRVQLKDISDISQLDEFVKNNQTLKPFLATDREPSFSGPRREAIKNISNWTVMAQRFGLAASVIFAAISSLIIFNTIRMAIFSRKEEIQMMKLIGADRQFIRGPFLVEAVVYGFIAAVLATGLGFATLIFLDSKLTSFGLSVGPTVDYLLTYLGFIVLGMIVLGAIIGVGSSLLATRRYLKI